MIDPQRVRNWDFGEVVQTYDIRDCILYALGLGFGDNPGDPQELQFVFEKALVTVPSMACILATPGSWLRDSRTGIDWKRAVHGEQRLEIFEPLPAAGTVVGSNRVTSLTDKGAGKGALIDVQRELYDQNTHLLLARVTQTVFLRGDGGFSAGGGAADATLPPLHAVPARTPDFEVTLPTLRQAALLYRLSGDFNPIHADPELAATAGFKRPILHGLCSFGMAVRAALKCGGLHAVADIRAMAARFTAPVYPGESLTFQMWRATKEQLHFRAAIRDRNVIALDNGMLTLSSRTIAASQGS
jgi:acyl dehydratase